MEIVLVRLRNEKPDVSHFFYPIHPICSYSKFVLIRGPTLIHPEQVSSGVFHTERERCVFICSFHLGTLFDEIGIIVFKDGLLFH